jgi:hypothetical protein
MSDILQEAHRRVWTFRRKYGNWWATPTILDAIRFAGTEAFKAVDALLRCNTSYARNNERQQDILEELADCAVMLLTALGPDYVFRPSNTAYPYPSEDFVDWVAGATGAALYAYRRWYSITQAHGREANHDIYREPILFALGFIVNYPGMDLLPMIDSRLKAKHILQEA